MRGLLPSVWLLGAALYTTSIFALTKPFSGDEEWPLPPRVKETVMAKQPLVMTQAVAEPETPLVLTLPAKPKAEPRDEWVQVAFYTTMVRARPSAEAPPLYAYSVGRPLRVIAREGRFVRVQDLGSGKLGWIDEASLAPFSGGYRQPEQRIAEPQIAAVAPPSVIAVEPDTAAAKPASAPVAARKPPPPRSDGIAARKPPPPRSDGIAARMAKETVAAASKRGLFRKRRGVQRVALGGQKGLASMIDRAIRGF
jgi:hypothetical protein